MKDEKLISIVMPVYNGAMYLADAIESVIQQTYQNWELIIVNDCSTDDSLFIAESYRQKEPRVRILSNEINLKLPRTLNVGFAAAQGEYYTWTSDDNLYKPEALSRLAAELNQHSKCVMAYSDYTNIDAEGQVIGPTILKDPQYIVSGNVFGACFLYRAEAAKRIGEYDATLFLAEDYDFWMRMYCAGEIHHIAESLYLYRRHGNSLTSTRKEAINIQTYKAFEKNFLPLYADAKQHGLVFELFNQIMSRVPNEQKEQVLQKLCAVNNRYRWYLHMKNLKRKLRATPIGVTYRALKGIVKK